MYLLAVYSVLIVVQANIMSFPGKVSSLELGKIKHMPILEPDLAFTVVFGMHTLYFTFNSLEDSHHCFI